MRAQPMRASTAAVEVARVERVEHRVQVVVLAARAHVRARATRRRMRSLCVADEALQLRRTRRRARRDRKRATARTVASSASANMWCSRTCATPPRWRAETMVRAVVGQRQRDLAAISSDEPPLEPARQRARARPRDRPARARGRGAARNRARSARQPWLVRRYGAPPGLSRNGRVAQSAQAELAASAVTAEVECPLFRRRARAVRHEPASASRSMGRATDVRALLALLGRAACAARAVHRAHAPGGQRRDRRRRAADRARRRDRRAAAGGRRQRRAERRAVCAGCAQTPIVGRRGAGGGARRQRRRHRAVRRHGARSRGRQAGRAARLRSAPGAGRARDGARPRPRSPPRTPGCRLAALHRVGELAVGDLAVVVAAARRTAPRRSPPAARRSSRSRRACRSGRRSGPRTAAPTGST